MTHPGKPYFSKQTRLSKLDLVRYYLSIAPGALAGIRDRPLFSSVSWMARTGRRFIRSARRRSGRRGSHSGRWHSRQPHSRRSWWTTRPAGLVVNLAASNFTLTLVRTAISIIRPVARRSRSCPGVAWADVAGSRLEVITFSKRWASRLAHNERFPRHTRDVRIQQRWTSPDAPCGGRAVA